MKQERGIVRLILPQGDLFLLNMMPTMRPIRRKIKRLGLKRRRETDRRCKAELQFRTKEPTDVVFALSPHCCRFGFVHKPRSFVDGFSDP